NWPVFSGDRITTGNSAAVISFHDGSRVVVDMSTTVVLLNRSNSVGLQIVKGQVRYKLSRVADYAIGSVQASLTTPPSATGSATTLASGNLVFGADSGILSTVETFARAGETTTASYPISITYGSLPSGVTTTPGPDPTSVVTPAH